MGRKITVPNQFFQKGDKVVNDPKAIRTHGALSSGAIIPFLIGTVLALVAANVYTFYQLNQFRAELDRVRNEPEVVRNELDQTREQLLAELAKANQATIISTQSNKSTVESLKSEFQVARKQASELSGQARVAADKHADELAAKLEQAQEQQARQVNAVASDVSKVRTDNEATKTSVNEVSNQVATVKSDLTATQSELQKTIASLKSAKGDLDSQMSLIATNATELQALKERGERNYLDFSLTVKDKTKHLGDVTIQLKSTDVKKNRFTVDVIADDKTVTKKDRTVNEPLQFIVSGSRQPYELVVNEVSKDAISGYLSAPKVQPTRR